MVIFMRKNIKSVIKICIGSIFSIICAIILFIIYSSLLVHTDLNENTIHITVLIISLISIFFGGIISSIKIKRNGFINGSIVGLTFMIVFNLLSIIMVDGYNISIKSIGFIIIAIIIGAIGGVIGLNTIWKPEHKN